MKNSIVAGAVAGLVGSIVAIIFGVILCFVGWCPMPTSQSSVVMIIISIIFGAIFGRIYEMVQRSIPGKGSMKGLNFGLLIWLICDIAAGAYVGLVINEVSTAIGLISFGFFTWIVYGYILGTLYK
jgi:hypothetical protein